MDRQTSVCNTVASLVCGMLVVQFCSRPAVAEPVEEQEETLTRSQPGPPQFRLRGAGWFSTASGYLQAGDPVDEFPDAIRRLDIEDTLNLDTDELVVWGQVFFHFGKDNRWMIGGGYTGPFRYDGRAEISELVFDNTVYSGEIDSSTRFDIFEVNLGYNVVQTDRVELLLGGGARIFDLRSSIEGTVASSQGNLNETQRESISEIIPIPTALLGLKVNLSDALYTRGTVAGGWFGDYGAFLDASAEIGFDFTPNVGIFGGYRWIHAEADISDVEFDFDIHGIYTGLEFRF